MIYTVIIDSITIKLVTNLKMYQENVIFQLAGMVGRYQCKNAKNTIYIWHLSCT